MQGAVKHTSSRCKNPAEELNLHSTTVECLNTRFQK